MPMQIDPRQAAVIIDGALNLVRAGHDRPAVAASSLAGLQLVRQAVSEHAGYAALRQYDDWLGEQLAERRRHRLRTGEEPGAVLPAPGETAYRPLQIMREAVQSCFLLNGHAPGNALLLVASESLLDGLIDAAGLPASADLVAALEAHPERDDDAVAAVRPVTIQ